VRLRLPVQPGLDAAGGRAVLAFSQNRTTSSTGSLAIRI